MTAPVAFPAATPGAGRKRILMVFRFAPYPLRAHGVSVRYLPVIEHLSRRHDLDVILVGRPSEEREVISGLERLCRAVTVLEDPRRLPCGVLSRWRTYAGYLAPWTPQFSETVHGGRIFTRDLVRAAGKARYDTIVWVGGTLFPYFLTAAPELRSHRLVIDFVDSPSLWAQRRKNRIFPVGVLERYERWKTRRWEAKAAALADATLYISEVDARSTSRDAAAESRTQVIPNGINADGYTDGRRPDISSPNIGYFGNMSYPPNVEAVLWLHEKVFLPLRKRQPGLDLIVIGRNPAPEVLALGRNPGVRVTGTVADIWPYVNSVDVFVFPLLRGAGLKNKILEAMYAGRPVVTTSIGNEGIDAVTGRDLVVCHSPEEYIASVDALLRSPEQRSRMGLSAREYVSDRFSLDSVIRRFEAIIVGSEGAPA